MRIKLVATGNPWQAKIVNAETGEPIEHVIRAEYVWDSRGREIQTLWLTILRPEVEIVGEARVQEVPA